MTALNETKRGNFRAAIVITREGAGIATNQERVTWMSSRRGRFEALSLGIHAVRSSRVLILDDDQVLDQGLASELNEIEGDAIFVPERSLNRNLVGRFMDLKRAGVENLARKAPNPAIPAVPRCYDAPTALRALARVGEAELRAISQHEDSVLYFEVARLADKVGWAHHRILNLDPPLGEFLKKSFDYGLSQSRAIRSPSVTAEHQQLLRAIDRGRLENWGAEGLYPGLLADMVKGTPYLLGLMAGRLSSVELNS